MRILTGRVLIKKLKESRTSNNGLVIGRDPDDLPEAEVVLIADDVSNIVSVGDKVYYTTPRENGKCMYNDKEHFIIPISNIIAVI